MNEHDANQWMLEAITPPLHPQYVWHTPNANDLKPTQRKRMRRFISVRNKPHKVSDDPKVM